MRRIRLSWQWRFSVLLPAFILSLVDLHRTTYILLMFKVKSLDWLRLGHLISLPGSVVVLTLSRQYSIVRIPHRLQPLQNDIKRSRQWIMWCLYISDRWDIAVVLWYIPAYISLSAFALSSALIKCASLPEVMFGVNISIHCCNLVANVRFTRKACIQLDCSSNSLLVTKVIRYRPRFYSTM